MMTSLNEQWFPQEVLPKPSGYYAHIIVLRATDSYGLFQTDGELNTARVRAGESTSGFLSRIEIFKRKQTTPERLTGRELLRRYELLSAEPSTDRRRTTDDRNRPICDYNVAFCMTCPDCIIYGFAIGDSGSEKAKVITDTAYSLTAYEDSHETRTLNAPYETGIMSRQGEVTSRINEQDHVKPGVIFPAIVTVRDVTANLFRYVLQNILRTRHYGAQTTRTGTMTNHLIAVALTDGEIFSNLKFTQRLYDALLAQDAIHPPDPIDLPTALTAAHTLVPELLREDGVVVEQLIDMDDLQTLCREVLAADAAQMKQRLQEAFEDSKAYHERWIARARRR
jgi:CRISPR-associated protein Csc2